ncbi:hypothetical protein FB45DRAFT_897969 [Roridomyces roridus]|uniref:PHD-type domain-containing protein n=1 Tax=Roridomyces roridus TaxID=1738132 RepID=A0AAD7CDS2_9AGAR|nr:hypothetical protein FB45DRAFT_897969 [Roridomyces roridus]
MLFSAMPSTRSQNYNKNISESPLSTLPDSSSPPPRQKRKAGKAPAGGKIVADTGRETTCQHCGEGESESKGGLVACSKCRSSSHAPCVELSEVAGGVIRNYDWVCHDCKWCEVCKKDGNADRLLFCDHCDRGWHTFCLEEKSELVPPNDWFCPPCREAKLQGSLIAESTSRLPETPKSRKSQGTVSQASRSATSHATQSTSHRRKRQRVDSNTQGSSSSANKTNNGDSDDDSVQIIDPNSEDEITLLLKQSEKLSDAQDKLMKEKEAKLKQRQELATELKTQIETRKTQLKQGKVAVKAIDTDIERLKAAKRKTML